MTQFDAQQQAAQRNLSYLIAEKIAQRILSGEFKAESILPGENELGEMYEVSRTAIREAVKILAAKGMLLPRPRIGTRIMPRNHWNFLDKDLLSWWITQDNFQEVTQHFVVLRKALEPQAAALAAINASKEQRDKLSLLIKDMQALNISFDRERWIETDTQFHKEIYNSSANPLLIAFANLFNTAYQSYFSYVAHDTVIKLNDHQSIVDAILARDSLSALNATQSLLEKDI